MRIALLNLNLDPQEQGGCLRIEAALRGLLAETGEMQPQLALLAAADVRRSPALLQGADALVLGPQGTPFSAYDAEFLPWLRALVDAPRPVLGVCGGMQALALAHGGALAATFGGVIGAEYEGHRKVRGPLPIALDAGALPSWLGAHARSLLTSWQVQGGQAFQSHVEQVAVLPDDFVVVASSAPTPVEAFAHRVRPILASQFHPELGWDEGCAAGRLWLRAWLASWR